jgi:hypothetical protein
VTTLPYLSHPYLSKDIYTPSDKQRSPKYRNRNNRKIASRQTKKEVQKLLNKNKYITNLSSRTLTSDQIDVLSLGMTFVPSKSHTQAQLSEPLNNFDRSNRLKYFFRNKPPTEPHPFRKKSTWVPPSASPAIEGYLRRIRTEINTLHPLKMFPNLSPAQVTAVKQLSSDQTLVIKKADKGSGIVVEDTTQ